MGSGGLKGHSHTQHHGHHHEEKEPDSCPHEVGFFRKSSLDSKKIEHIPSENLSSKKVSHAPSVSSGQCQSHPSDNLAAKKGRHSESCEKKRKSHGLQVSTMKSGFMGLLKRLNNGSHRRRIRWTHNIGDHYLIGPEVFPSTHRAMEVRHAMRLEDKMRLVVKVRDKQESFACPQEHKDWRISTEFMMNMPKSQSIVEFIEVLEDSKNYYVFMEKASGMDLFEVLDIHGRLPIADCKEIIYQLVWAVSELHERGCIHKDLKLENIMVDRSPSLKRVHTTSFNSLDSTTATIPDVEPSSPPIVKLIDFDTVEPQVPKHHHHQNLSVVGTNQYIAQEAYAGEYSPASDIFAVGVIAYRLLTGAFPFHPGIFDDEAGENWVGSPKMAEIRDRVQHFEINFKRVPFPSEPEACDLVRRMLAVEQSDRPKAIDALRSPWLAPRHPSPRPQNADSTLPTQESCSSPATPLDGAEAVPLPPGVIDS